ncbi:hypothetical protein FRB99_000793 [Tulasnella sp. 403]|nr:hypothetical protein FRB99_000793 [Tulasnella sp. 403]
MSGNCLISSATWVARGLAKRQPATYEVDDKELERISALAQISLDEARAELQQATEEAQNFKPGGSDDGDDDAWEDDVDADGDVSMDVDGDDDATRKGSKSKNEKRRKNKTKAEATSADPNDELAVYKLDEYDREEAKPVASIFSNIKGLAYYADNTQDPYITLKNEEDEEKEDLEVLPSDNLIVAAKTEDDISSLEIYVYDESEDNLYRHHDIILPSLPLCLEWLDFPPHPSDPASTSTGSYIAVGTFEPEIEIWSLDVVEPLYPNTLLGALEKKTEPSIPTQALSAKKKSKKEKKRKPNPERHVDAVLGLSWNRSHRNLLASASADKTVKLWDLSREMNAPAIRSFDVHKDKVQAVQWNKAEPTVLLTGSYDRTVRTFDSRSPTTGVGAKLPADVEALRWDPWEGHTFFVSLENGLVLNYDARTLSSDLKVSSNPLFTLQADDGAASAMDVNAHVRGCIATGGSDGLVKVWDINENQGKPGVTCVVSRNLEVGQVFTVAWSPDDPLTLTAGGSQGKLQVWDVAANKHARKALESKLPQRQWKERDNGGVVGLVDDSGDESDEEEDS